MTELEELQQHVLATAARLYQHAVTDLEASAHPRRPDGPVVRSGGSSSSTEIIALRDPVTTDYDRICSAFEQMADRLTNLERTLRRRNITRRFL